VAAGAASLGVSYLFRSLVGGVFLPELAVNALVTHTPGTVESVLVTNLQSLAKYSAFAGAISVNLLLYGFLAYFLTGIKNRGGYAERVPLYSLAAYGVTLCASLVFLSLTQILSTPQSVPSVILALLPSQFVFGILLATEEKFSPVQTGVLCEPLKPPSRAKRMKFNQRRRLFIKAGVATAVGGALLYYGVSLLFPNVPTSTPAAAVSSLYAQEVTANGSFYRVDVNIFPPSLDSSSWSLQVSGMVANPTSISYAQLMAMEQVEQYNTLECVSNEIGGDLISTAKWTGVKLSDVLQTAQVQQGATYVVFKATDGYSVGIPLDTALLEGTILAYQMNGEPLPQDHGFPMRAIVPGLYGMMNAKWITSIEVVAETYSGYWQQRGWENDAHYNTMSSIVDPGGSQIDDRFGFLSPSYVPLGMTPIAGVAFAGDRGIEKVEVSTDGGETWTPASLKDPLSGNTWVLWTAEWNPPATGTYRIEVRATDMTGAVQTAVIAEPFPNGATGYHVVDVGVTNATSA
jgi:DMSO/TMAO reductase YedYZ molybdopterin-dependent catalytic subunit